MEVLRNLFEGYPNLWGGGVAHSVLILSLTIAFGIILAKIKVRGVSLGVTWILFVGIVFGHFNMNLDEHLLHFLKEFGLILFVYSIGLQMDKLTSQSVEYIMESLSNTTQPIKNIRAYLRTVILNAPGTMESYYQVQANAAVAANSHPPAPAGSLMAGAVRRFGQKRRDGA